MADISGFREFEQPNPESVMEPAPTPEQDALWDAIYEEVSVDDLKREEKFINLRARTQAYLASRGLAEQMGQVGIKFSFEPWQVRRLARVVKYFYLKEWPVTDFAKHIMTEVRISSDVAGEVKKALDPLLIPAEGAVPEPVPPADPSLPSAPALAPSPSPPPQPTSASQSKEGDAPFMIHEEKPSTPLRQDGGGSFSFKTPDALRAPALADKPSARIIKPSGENGPTVRRVVHYGNLKTMLNADDISRPTET